MGAAEPPAPQPPSDDRVSIWVGLLRSLTLSNVLVLAALALVAVPVYTVWKALNDDDGKLLDRLLSTYEEISSPYSGCTLRHVQQRGGPELWGISSGFAFQGESRWFVNVVLAQREQPSDEEIASYCESLKLIADKMLSRGDDRNGGAAGDDEPSGGSEIHPGSVPGAATDWGRRDRLVPASPEEAE